ncbi:MAG: phage tail protein [Acidobacteriota bacterium]
MPFPPELTLERDLLGFRFGVFFFAGGLVPNPLDIRFKRVGGLTATVKTKDYHEGGQSMFTQKLPVGIDYTNLVLERGLVVGSPLHLEISRVLEDFQFRPSNVLITLFNEDSLPVTAWLVTKAIPVKWSTSDLDAGQKSLVIETLELTYARMQVMRI